MARRGVTRLAAQAAYWRTHGRHDVAERIEAQLVAERRCVVCGRPLTNPASCSRRVGPECWKKTGGQEKEGAES